jgi:NAD(P)-dependent dehydrogenase (short-subunit alcohol dehydrogenase family)
MAARKKQSKVTTKTQSNQPKSTAGGRLSGKVAVVTGGNRGLGLAIARTLVGEGCSVLITGRDPAALAKAKSELKTIAAGLSPHPEVLSQRCEVRKPESIASVFAAVKRHWGRLDILINNAGILQPMFPVEKTPIELWRSVIDTNLTGIFLCARAAVPLMKRGATIVNNLSLAAKQIFPKISAYNASKHGALGLTLTLREELISKGIRVTALMPGAADTAIWNQFWPDAPRDKMIEPKSVAQAVLYAVLLPPNANLGELIVVPVVGAL